MSTPILQFENKLIYGTAATLGEDDEYEEHGIAIVDMEEDVVQYETFGTDRVGFALLFATNEHAYILGDNGYMYVFDQNFHYKIYEPFKHVFNQDYYHVIESEQLVLDENRILYSFRGTGGDEQYALGIIHLNEEPVFEIFNEAFANTESWYELLYQNVDENEIYVKEMSNTKKNNHVIILDSDSLEIKVKFPVDYNHLLDFVVKISN